MIVSCHRPPCLCFALLCGLDVQQGGGHPCASDGDVVRDEVKPCMVLFLAFRLSCANE